MNAMWTLIKDMFQYLSHFFTIFYQGLTLTEILMGGAVIILADKKAPK